MDWADFCAANLSEPHTIVVEAFKGTGAYGDAYGIETEVTPCYVEDVRRRVRVQTQDAAGGEVISSTTVYCPPSTIAPAGSRVTLPDGRVTTVISVSALDAAGLDLPEHVELLLE